MSTASLRLQMPEEGKPPSREEVLTTTDQRSSASRHVNSALELAIECGDLRLLNALAADERYVARLNEMKSDAPEILARAREWAVRAEAYERLHGPESLIDHIHWAIVDREKSRAAIQAKKSWLAHLARKTANLRIKSTT